MIYYVRELRKKCTAIEMNCFEGSIATGKIDILLPCNLFEYLAELRQLGVDTVFYSTAYFPFSDYLIKPRLPGDELYQKVGPDKYEKQVEEYNAYIVRLRERLLENGPVLGRCTAVYQGRLLCWQQFEKPDEVELTAVQRSALHIPYGMPAATIRSDKNTFDYAAAAKALDEGQPIEL